MKIKLLKPVHLVAPDTNEAVRPEDKGKVKKVKNSSFWVQAQAQGYVKVIDDKPEKDSKEEKSEKDSKEDKPDGKA